MKHSLCLKKTCRKNFFQKSFLFNCQTFLMTFFSHSPLFSRQKLSSLSAKISMTFFSHSPLFSNFSLRGCKFPITPTYFPFLFNFPLFFNFILYFGLRMFLHSFFSPSKTFVSPSLFFSSGSLPTRQVQMFDVAIPLVVELVLSASYILPPSSSPASFVLVFLLIFFLAVSPLK